MYCSDMAVKPATVFITTSNEHVVYAPQPRRPALEEL